MCTGSRPEPAEFAFADVVAALMKHRVSLLSAMELCCVIDLTLAAVCWRANVHAHIDDTLAECRSPHFQLWRTMLRLSRRRILDLALRLLECIANAESCFRLHDVHEDVQYRPFFPDIPRHDIERTVLCLPASAFNLRRDCANVAVYTIAFLSDPPSPSRYQSSGSLATGHSPTQTPSSPTINAAQLTLRSPSTSYS